MENWGIDEGSYQNSENFVDPQNFNILLHRDNLKSIYRSQSSIETQLARLSATETSGKGPVLVESRKSSWLNTESTNWRHLTKHEPLKLNNI